MACLRCLLETLINNKWLPVSRWPIVFIAASEKGRFFCEKSTTNYWLSIQFLHNIRNFEDGLAAAQAGVFAKARELWLIEAEKGDASAQDNLGIMYKNGQGVPQDDKEAVKWYRMAAEQEDARAQTTLGVRYFNG